MNHGTTHTNHCKIYQRLLAWLRGCLIRLGQRVFATSDAAARQQDWQIISSHAGLGRRYRDPRFDTLAPCSRCRGTRTPGNPCQTCNGPSRIALSPNADPTPRRPG